MAKDLNGKELGRGIVQLRSGSYQARIYIKGYSKPIYASSKNLKEVKKKREKILARYQLGLQADISKITLNDWFDEWMELYVVGKVKQSTIYNYIGGFNRCKDYIGNVTLDRLQTVQIQIMVNELFKKGYKRPTVKQSLAILSACLERAVIIRMLFFNPCKGVVLQNDSQFEPVDIEDDNSKRLTDEEIERFFSYAKKNRYYELYLILLNTGMRAGEACALEWKDVDLENRYIHVYKTIGRPKVYYDEKGNKLKVPCYLTQITSPKKEASIRKIPLNETAIEAFESWRLKQQKDQKRCGRKWGNGNGMLKQYPGLIFTTPNGFCYLPKTASSDCARIAKMMNFNEAKKAEFENQSYKWIKVRPHLLRHTFISRCYEAGMDPAVIMLISGHKHIEMMEHYTHLDEKFINKEFGKMQMNLSNS